MARSVREEVIGMTKVQEIDTKRIGILEAKVDAFNDKLNSMAFKLLGTLALAALNLAIGVIMLFLKKP